MFYIHQASCISPQQTFSTIDLDVVKTSTNNKFTVIEPTYDGISKNILRRMGKAVRIGIGASLPILHKADQLSGFIIGTANGGMEESILFLKQIITYDEGVLAPGSFVQSTANATAAQLSLLSGNKGYNTTHVHRGLAFEMAAIDAAMMLQENRENSYLLGGMDELAENNYQLEYLDNWFKTEPLQSQDLYTVNTPGSIAGEGSAAFLVNKQPGNALAKVVALKTLHTTDAMKVKDELKSFIEKYATTKIDLFLSGENGDNRQQKFYNACENLLDGDISIARFKHLCGEYPTASAFALWLCCQLLNGVALPQHMIKKMHSSNQPKTILLYNSHKNIQHSFMLVENGKLKMENVD